MAVQIWKDYVLGDMTVRYLTDERKKQVGLALLPTDMPVFGQAARNEHIDPLVQLKVAGDIYHTPYAMGNSMRNSETVRKLEFQVQEDLMLEMFESFSIGSISPYLDGDGHEQMYLHRIRGVWR